MNDDAWQNELMMWAKDHDIDFKIQASYVEYDNNAAVIGYRTCEKNELLSITELEIEYKSLSILPDTIGKLNSLILMSLDGNNLTKLPDSIGDLNNLERLSLRSCPYTQVC
jgi:hypothetical protein